MDTGSRQENASGQEKGAANHRMRGFTYTRAFANQRSWQASAANLKFLTVVPRVLHRNFKFEAALESKGC
jgi:hypothetical protein